MARRYRDAESSESDVEAAAEVSPGKLTAAEGSKSRRPIAPGKRTATQFSRGAKGPPPEVIAALESEHGVALPDAPKWSKRVGADVGHARIVTGAKAEEAAAAIHAAAFTVGERVFLGSGATLADEELIAHELTHVAQQRGAEMPEMGELGMTSPNDRAEQEAGGEHAHGAITSSPVQIAAWPPRGPWGGGNPFGGGTPDPQIDAFKYFEKYGKKHFEELGLAELRLDTESPYATWASGNSSAFLASLNSSLATSNVPAKPIELAEQTLAPKRVSAMIDAGRDAENKDAREKGNDYNLGVTLELRKEYRGVIREALKRLMPRVIQEWNQRTLEDWAKRNKESTIKIPEHPETNHPGVGVLQSHPIDRFVLGALTGFINATIKPDFAAYRKAFPEEAKPRAGKDWFRSLRPVKFEWQAPQGSRNWIKVTDPIDATTEEVAKELFGYPDKAYLITAAAPLFGLDLTTHMLKQPYEAQHSKLYSHPAVHGRSLPNQILVGPQGDDAALNQATKFKAEKAEPAVVLQQFDLLIDELRKIGANEVFALSTKDIAGTIKRIEKRKADVAAKGDTDKWNAQVREQLDIASKSQEALKILGKMWTAYEAWEAKNLAWEIGLGYIDAAVSSDLVTTARQSLDRANQRMISFPADWIDAQFRWIKRALLASHKHVKSGDDLVFIMQLEEKEKKLRVDLAKLREKLFASPLEAQAEIDKVTAELQKLATGAATIRNIESSNEVFEQLKEAKSPTGWIRSLFSNRITGDHGNDRLDALAARAEKFQAEWNVILNKWKSGKQDEAAADLEAKSKSTEWKTFFEDVAKEIKDQAKYDAWMTFALLVGIAILTGFAGVLIEPLAAAAVGPILGFVVTVTTEAALFTTMSYFLVEKNPSMAGFRNEFGKNIVVFGVLKGISKLFAGAEKLLAVELKELEVITQFATINGIALYEANKEKARRGETLTEGEILKISFDNLVFMIAVAIGGKMLAPAFQRFRLRGEVGKQLKQIETLHAEVLRLEQAAKTTKSKELGELLLERQRELLTAEREFIEALVKLTAEGRGEALKKGMTNEQYDALMKAQKDLGDATISLREAEIMSKLEPVTKEQYLIEPGKEFDNAHKHYAETNKKGTTPITGEPGSRTFEVSLPDGSKMRISERAGKKGQVGTETTTVNTPGGESTPPRAEEVAKAHSITDPVALKSFEALYKAHPKEVLALLEALKSQPGLASKLMAQFGAKTLETFQPTADNLVSIHGEVDIAPAKLAEIVAREPAAKVNELVKLAKEKTGTREQYEYFEQSSDRADGGAGYRLRFKSRVEQRSKAVAKELLEALGIKDPTDPRAKLFENMSEGDAIRLWDLFNEPGYKDAGARKQAAEWAFGKNPKTAREFVAEFQFYDAEITIRAEQITKELQLGLAREIVDAQSKKPAGPLTDAEVKAVIRRYSKAKLGNPTDSADGPAWARAGRKQAIAEFGAVKTGKDGQPITVGAERANDAWKLNNDAQTGKHAAGALQIGTKSDGELPGHVKSIAETLSFGNKADAAYHAHKHAGELGGPRPSAASEMTAYLDAARALIKSQTGQLRHNQNGSRSVVFTDGKMRAIVNVSAKGEASIATFGKAN